MMCLSSVLSSKRIPSATGTGYQIVQWHRKDWHPFGCWFQVDKPFGVWLYAGHRAAQKNPIYKARYAPGFHLFANANGAVAQRRFMREGWNGHGSVIVEVEWRGLLATGRQYDSDIIVAERIMLLWPVRLRFKKAR